MFVINLPTLILILTISKFLFAIVLFYLKFKISSIKAIGYWAFGSLLSAISTFVFSEFPYPASTIVDFSYSFLFNISLVGSECFFLAGFWSFKGKPINKWMLSIFPFVTAISTVVFSFFFPVLWIRWSINAFLMLLLCTICTFELFESPKKSLNSLFRWNSVFYFLYAISQLIRLVSALVFRPVNPLGVPSIVSIYLYAILGVCLLLFTYNLILIVTTSLNDELDEQIKAKNKLYAIVAHDLRNPLGNLNNYISILKQSYDKWDADKVNTWIGDMDKMTSSSRLLLENLLHWSKSQLNEIRVQSSISTLNNIVDEVALSLKYMIDHKKNRLLVQIEPETKAYFDADMITLVIRNLCTNAIKFTPPDGTILISVVIKSSQIEVAVTDNGIGIGQDKLALIFDSKSNYSTYGTNGEKGSGFGLLLCKEFVELNGGEIWVRSTPNVGSCFAFTLPLLPPMCSSSTIPIKPKSL